MSLTSPSTTASWTRSVPGKIVYRQLKHSTAHADEAWTVSGLKRTLEGFGEKFFELNGASTGLIDRVTFDFVSNRPVDAAVVQALTDIGKGIDPADPRIARTSWNLTTGPIASPHRHCTTTPHAGLMPSP